MKTEIIQTLTSNFESYAKKSENGVEFWLARDLQRLLGYDKWDNFLNAIFKAQASCETTGRVVSDHFAGVGKTIQMPKGAEKTVDDFMLTRLACYLIAQNGDPRKGEIAFAQNYFAVQTRKYEIIEQRLLESERISAWKKLAGAEKELSGVIFEQTGSEKNFGLIRSKGDKALFSYSTEEMKGRWNVPKGRVLADFAPTIILKAKDFATEITIFNVKAKKMKTEIEISGEHVTNNSSVRKTLIERGIRPESLPPEKDIKKVERKLASEGKQALETSSSLK
jgi:DNA-damage-inducible protein D